MSIINQLASSLNRRDEVPNQELAKRILESKDRKAIKELIENLQNDDKDIQSDCIKVLYEIGESQPGLVAPYAQDFIDLLKSKNNRLQWGAMAALDYITLSNPSAIYKVLSKIIATTENGSVITMDHAVNILIKLCTLDKYANSTFPLLIEQLLKCPANQLPMYAERTMPIINSFNNANFMNVLISRLDDIEKESKRKRMQQVIKKLG